MASRTTINDFQPALERIDRLLDKYEPKHQGTWLKQDCLTHANHGRIHAQAAEFHFLSKLTSRQVDILEAEIEENLASNACRALMLLTRYLELKNG